MDVLQRDQPPDVIAYRRLNAAWLYIENSLWKDYPLVEVYPLLRRPILVLDAVENGGEALETVRLL